MIKGLVRPRRWILMLFLPLLGACASAPTPPPEILALEQRLQRLEGRVEALERRDTIDPAVPYRSRAEIEANIKSLEAERARLLVNYESAHPDVRDVDRRIKLLEKQLERMNQQPKATH
jgi:chromosome segregation ATPase